MHFSLVVFRHRGSDEFNQSLLDAVNQTGEALLSPNVLAGRKVIRLAIGNIQTNEADLNAVWALVQEKAAMLNSMPA